MMDRTDPEEAPVPDDVLKPGPTIPATEEMAAAGREYRQMRLRQPMPPSLRRQFLNRRTKRELGAKGIPPWRARKLFR